MDVIRLDDPLDTLHQKICELGCKRSFFDLPIDYYGDVHMCFYDWYNEYEIDNIFDSSVEKVVLSQRYQKLLEQSKRGSLDP